jgi:hypothetical protein
MKIYYKSTGFFLTDMCPDKDVAIGPTACKQCEHNIHTNSRENWVDCAKNEEIKQDDSL